MKTVLVFVQFLLFTCVAIGATLPDSSSVSPEQNGLNLLTISGDSVSAEPQKTVSIGGAFLRSLLIPGWGQRAAGAPKAARNFFVADVALWTGFASFQIYGNWIEDDYHLLAAQHAGVNPTGKDDQFFVNVGNYASVDDYNQSRLQRRDVQGLYDPAENYWKWDLESNQQRFDRLRVRSDRAYDHAELVIAAVLANHIISGIHAAWKAHRRASLLDDASHPHGPTPYFGFKGTSKEIRLVAMLKF